MRPGIAQFAWILQISLGLMYLVAGLSKLIGAATMMSLFEAVGFGQWFRYAVGATETTGAVLLFTPSWSGVAAVALAPLMVGAVAIGFLLPGESPVPAGLCLTGLLAVAWIRRAATIRVVLAVFGR
jgi:putative oxidoreductase